MMLHNVMLECHQTCRCRYCVSPCWMCQHTQGSAPHPPASSSSYVGGPCVLLASCSSVSIPRSTKPYSPNCQRRPKKKKRSGWNEEILGRPHLMCCMFPVRMVAVAMSLAYDDRYCTNTTPLNDCAFMFLTLGICPAEVVKHVPTCQGYVPFPWSSDDPLLPNNFCTSHIGSFIQYP